MKRSRNTRGNKYKCWSSSTLPVKNTLSDGSFPRPLCGYCVVFLRSESESDWKKTWEDFLVLFLCRSRLTSPNLRNFVVCGCVLISVSVLRSIGEDECKWDTAFDQRRAVTIQMHYLMCALKIDPLPLGLVLPSRLHSSKERWRWASVLWPTCQCNSGLIWTHSCDHQEQKASLQTC